MSFKTIDMSSFIEFKTVKVTDAYTFLGRIDGGAFGDVYKASCRLNVNASQED